MNATDDRLKYSVIVPVFCEAESLEELSGRVVETFSKMAETNTFELIFVDDGSTDTTPEVIQSLSRQYDFICSIRMRRNVGKALALMAGMQSAKGDIVFTMDGDLQDNPEDISVFVDRLNEGFDVVSGYRKNRQDTFVRKIGSKIYNAFIISATNLKIHDMNCGFKAYSREAAKSLCIFGQYHRYIPLQAHYLGFRVGEAEISNSDRKHGKSKYRAIRYEGFFDLLSIMFSYRYGLVPMHFFGSLGLCLMVPSALTLGWLIISQLMFLVGFGPEFQVAERPLISLSVLAFLLGGTVFLSGFICDFFLHLHVRDRIGGIIASYQEGNCDENEPSSTKQMKCK